MTMMPMSVNRPSPRPSSTKNLVEDGHAHHGHHHDHAIHSTEDGHVHLFSLHFLDHPLLHSNSFYDRPFFHGHPFSDCPFFHGQLLYIVHSSKIIHPSAIVHPTIIHPSAIIHSVTTNPCLKELEKDKVTILLNHPSGTTPVLYITDKSNYGQSHCNGFIKRLSERTRWKRPKSLPRLAGPSLSPVLLQFIPSSRGPSLSRSSRLQGDSNQENKSAMNTNVSSLNIYKQSVF